MTFTGNGSAGKEAKSIPWHREKSCLLIGRLWCGSQGIHRANCGRRKGRWEGEGQETEKRRKRQKSTNCA